MVDGKALVDLQKLGQCDLDGTCVEVCPTKVVTLTIQAQEPAPAVNGHGGAAAG